MKILLLLAFVLGSITSFATAKINNWQLKNDLKTTKVWQNKKFAELYVSIEKSTIDNKSEYQKVIEGSGDEDKAKTLSLIGVSSWKASQRKWKKVGNKDFYIIEGSYIDNSDQDIQFQEYHLVTDKLAMKILFTTENEKALLNKEDIDNFLKEISPGDVNE